jgi:aspartate aminotransferase
VAAAANGKLSPEELDRAITSRARWLILSNPVNPTGGLYSKAELAVLASVLERHPHVKVSPTISTNASC